MFPPAASDVVSTAVASLDGPTTNLAASSASGMTGTGWGGTLTALIIATAFGALTSGSVVAANTGKLGSEVVMIFGNTGLAGASDNFGMPMGNTGFWTGGSLARKVDSSSGFDSTGCSSRGATGAGMAGAGSITRLGSRSGYANLGGATKSGRRIVCTPLVESEGLETIF